MYQAVLSNTHYGGTRGAVRTFAIEDVEEVLNEEGEDWEFDLETGQSDFETFITELKNFGPPMAKITAMIPFTKIDSSCECTNNPSNTVDNLTTYLRSYFDETTVYNNVFTAPNKFTNMLGYPNTNWSTISFCEGFSTCESHVDHSYAGNGYVHLNFNKGWYVYGGGIRVAELTTKNGDGEAYKTKYTYLEGVATDENSPYSFQELTSIKNTT